MKKITVTIGIPAYNEEQNIRYFLQSILEQKTKTIELKRILIYSDASTDKTNEIVKAFGRSYQVVKFIKGKTRKGKYYRVNEFFKKSESDVLVIFDADIALEKNIFLETLVTSLVKDKNAAMMAARVKYIKQKGFIASILHSNFILGDYISMSATNHDNSENFHGAATAYKKSFIKTLNITSAMIDPHFYIYLSARKINGFRLCFEALVLQYPPSTLKDIKQLMQRSIGKRDPLLVKLFGETFIKEARFISKKVKIRGILKYFIHHPFSAPIALLMQIYLGRIIRVKKVDKKPIWEINTSTKKSIIYAK